MMKHEYTKVHFRRRRALVGEGKACSGCQTCAVVCSLVHEGEVDLMRARLTIKSNSFAGSFNPQVCHQCADAPCYYACPEGAMEIEAVNGTVLILEEKCTGCGACAQACPFRAIRLDEEKKKAWKCDFCGGNPQCFQWCPANALGVVEFGGEIPK